MPPILESPRWEYSEATRWLGEDCAVATVERWRVEPLEQGWRLPARSHSRLRQSSSGRPPLSRAAIELEVQFENLADEWEQATDFESVVARKVMHLAYQRIIGMGYPAVPLILRRLQREPRQWFWALTSITGEDPADGQTSADGAAQAWLEWGRLRGIALA